MAKKLNEVSNGVIWGVTILLVVAILTAAFYIRQNRQSVALPQPSVETVALINSTDNEPIPYTVKADIGADARAKEVLSVLSGGGASWGFVRGNTCFVEGQ